MFTVEFILSDGSPLSIFWPYLMLLGMGIGFLTGLFGVGGGFLLTPCLNILFGIPWASAVGSTAAQIFFNSSVSTFKHWRRRNVDVKLGIIMAISASIGAYVGKKIMFALNDSAGTVEILGYEHSVLGLILKALFLILMSGVIYSILQESPSGGEDGGEGGVALPIAGKIRRLKIPPVFNFSRSGVETMTVWAPVIISFMVGILTGLLAVGGFVLFPLLVYVLGIPTSVAIGTGAFQIVFATAVSTVAYWREGSVWWPLVGLMLCGSIIGVQLGVHSASRFDGKKIRKYFSFVIGLGIAVIIYSLCRDFYYGPSR